MSLPNHRGKRRECGCPGSAVGLFIQTCRGPAATAARRPKCSCSFLTGCKLVVSVRSSPYRPRPSFKYMSTVERNIVSEQTSSQKREKLYVYKSTLATEHGLTPR